MTEPAGMRSKGVAMIWAGMLLYATGPVLIAASSVNAATFSIIRILMGVGLMGALCLVVQLRPRTVPRLSGFAPVGFALLCGVCFGLHQWFLALAVKALSVADVAVMNAISPLIVVTLGLLILGEKPSKNVAAWAPVAMLGSGLAIYLGSDTSPAGLVGVALALLNVLFFAMFLVLSKKCVSYFEIWPFLFLVMLGAALFVGPAVLLTQPALESPALHDLLLIAAVAVGPGAAGHFFMTSALRWVPVSLPPVIRLLQPFASGALAWFFLQQPFSIYHILGAAITAIGVLGALRGPRRA